MGLSQRLLEIIRATMPADAIIDTIGDLDGFKVRVYWKLNDDPDRPNKPSKTIIISISYEAATDFSSAPAPAQEIAYRRISEYLRRKLANFDPRHNTPKYETPPVEHWVITTADLNG